MNAIEALKEAREAMRERRSYCEQWEYKYDEIWDIEDKAIDQTIAALEAEKPDNRAMEVALHLYNNQAIPAESINEYAQAIQSCVESYHAKQCVACKKVEQRKYYPFGQEPIPPDHEATDDK